MLSGQKKLSMDKKLLTVLGCSGSVALTLLSSNPAQANSEREYVFNAPELESEIVEVPYSDTDYPFYDCSCSEYNAAEVEAIDREGDKAIDLYGCDCAGCRNLVRNLADNEKVASQK